MQPDWDKEPFHNVTHLTTKGEEKDMKLLNFEEYIDDVILKRGKDYFEDGRIEKIEEMDKHFYIIEIAGSDDYTVEIYINDSNKIIDIDCDCPYDWGDYCKHQAAALYALRQMKNLERDQPKPKKELNGKKKVDLKTLLSTLQQEELIQIILDASREYPEIEKRLLFTYATPEDEISSSKKLIKEYINRYKKNGFVEYDDVYYALHGMDITLEKAEEKIAKGDPETAVLLCLAILPIAIDMLEYCDDSDGFAGAVIDKSLDTIHEAISTRKDQMNDNLKDRLFSRLIKEALHQRYEGWTDWQMKLYTSVICLCDTQERRREFEKQLNMLAESSSDDSWSSKYVNENVKLLLLEIVERFDGEKEAFQFIRENINLSPFRTKAIEYFLEKGDYTEVVKLCEEGKVVDHAYRGIVSQWKEYQLRAYEGLNDIQARRKLMLEFLYENKYEYYPILKEIYPPNEWELVFQEILETFEKYPFLPSAYLEILKEENLAEKLLDYCQKHLSSIIELYPYLIKKYKDEANKLFVQYIELEAERSRDRKQYQKVCSIIKQYKKVSSSLDAQMLINRLKQTYVRRPAFIDELSKIK